MRVKYLQIHVKLCPRPGKMRSSAFLLIEVLVALMVLVVMVGALSGFISVWLRTDAQVRARHVALSVACDELERAALPAGRAGPTAREGTRVAVCQTNAGAVWAKVPAWFEQLMINERPAVHQVTVGHGEPGRGRQPCVVRVTG